MNVANTWSGDLLRTWLRGKGIDRIDARLADDAEGWRLFVSCQQTLASILDQLTPDVWNLPPRGAEEVQPAEPIGAYRIGLAGPAGSGKSTLAATLGLPVRHIAATIKEDTADLLQLAGYAAITPVIVHERRDLFRPFLQEYGTLMRHLLGGDYWIRQFLERTKDLPAVVCDDVRTVDDADALRKSGFLLVYIDLAEHVRLRRMVWRTLEVRGNPERYTSEQVIAAVDERFGSRNPDVPPELRALVHALAEQGNYGPTERALLQYPFDYRLDGFRSVESLRSDLVAWLGEVAAKRSRTEIGA